MEVLDSESPLALHKHRCGPGKAHRCQKEPGRAGSDAPFSGGGIAGGPQGKADSPTNQAQSQASLLAALPLLVLPRLVKDPTYFLSQSILGPHLIKAPGIAYKGRREPTNASSRVSPFAGRGDGISV